MLLTWIVYRNHWTRISSTKPDITIHRVDNQPFLDKQQSVIPLFDTIVKKIEQLQQSDDYSIVDGTTIDIQKIKSSASDTPRDGSGSNYQAFLLMEKYLSSYRGEAINCFIRKKAITAIDGTNHR
jgi:hypothetical protein